ncbi:hypothetical protein SEA_PLATTE_99 [Microbacterium phage Platte]|nr:hypothetical protein SEA_OLINDD_100 [Microbacterium phage OlinDD]AWY05923.1 hypothetical protein SEA_PIONEER3_100 [Microbacterium phage Pioneer3]QZD97691.1 hypothetical protein SEA_PLATTE_99 [Microbacterium phage Platte]
MSEAQEGAVGYSITQRKIQLDPKEGVRFTLGEDVEVTVSIRNGQLHVHSHAWAKSLAAIGEAGNVLRLAVIDR